MLTDAGPKTSEAVRAVQSVHAHELSPFGNGGRSTTQKRHRYKGYITNIHEHPNTSKKANGGRSRRPALSPRTGQQQFDQARNLLQQANEIVQLVGGLEKVNDGETLALSGLTSSSFDKTHIIKPRFQALLPSKHPDHYWTLLWICQSRRLRPSCSRKGTVKGDT